MCILSSEAVTRTKREWLEGRLVIRGEFTVDPTLRNKIIGMLEVFGAMICGPLIDRYCSLSNYGGVSNCLKDFWTAMIPFLGHAFHK